LLNTDWYIRQLRDEEPKVPMAVDDATLERVRTLGYLVNEMSGEYEAVNTWMVRNILRHDHGGKPAYLAVTVPNHMGLEGRMSLEGVVYRIYDDSVSTKDRIDTLRTRENLYQVFQYQGLFDHQGNYLPVPYKDENAYRLTQNYAAAHLQLG